MSEPPRPIGEVLMDYEIYDPEITTTVAVDTYDNPAGLTYVSNSSLEYWAGQFWAIVDGTTLGVVEGSTGQQIWLTTSEDGVTWTPPVQPFRDSLYCNNPISGSTLEWQPNLVVVGDELWCIWSGADTYISKLTNPAGKWINYRFEFATTVPSISTTITGAATGGRSTRATFDALTDWFAFPSQNPIVLANGMVLCPVTFQSQTLSTQTPAASAFTRQLKFNALLKTVNGTDWSVTRIDTSAFGDFCAWEPFAVENPAGHVYVYSRNLDARVTDEDFLLVARSLDGGVTFEPSVSAKMLVPSTRGYARRVAKQRWLMAHVDHPQNSTQNPDQALSQGVRRNGALFMSRRGVDDFIPGVNFSGHDTSMNYPQFTIGPDGAAYINYTSGVGSDIRRSLRVVKVDALPDDDTAYIHPRSVTIYDPPAATDPTLYAGPPAYYEFNGANQALSVTSLTATTGVTYTAWLEWDTGGDVIIDSRANSTTAFGQVFFKNGLAINALNFLHGFTLVPNTPTFLAAVIDNTAQTVTLYAASGGAFSTKTGHYRSILFAGQPADGDTVTINGVVYTFRPSASLTNEVTIGASVAATITNLATKLSTNSMSSFNPGSSRLIMTRTDIASFTATSGSGQISVESGIPLSSGPVSFGKKGASIGSSLTGYAGNMYEARVYASPLSVANLTNLYNAKASSFGYSTMGGTSTAPGSPLLLLDPGSPNLTEFPSVGAAPRCEIVSATLLRIHGEASASVELPYGATDVIIRYKLGATPTGTDKYVVATFGTVEYPIRLYIDAANPTSLYANDRLVAAVSSPTSFNTVTVRVSTHKINIGSFENYFAGKPRCYLGNAFPESKLAVSKTIDFDVSAMTATKAMN